MISKILCLTLFVVQSLGGTPWVGEPQTDNSWIQVHNNFVKQTAQHKTDIKIIFFGDSITWAWALNGKDIWNKYYAPLHSYNYGIPGDKTEHLIYRMEHGEFDGLDSKLVVLKIGTNNIGSNTEQDIAHGIKEIVDQILRRLPHAKVLLLGVLPRGGNIETKVENVNKIIAKYDDQKRVFYLDMAKHFQTTPGKVIKDLYVDDQLHLSTKGYQVWHDTMQTLFDKLSK